MQLCATDAPPSIPTASARDEYAPGTTHNNGTEKQDFALDMQVLDYESLEAPASRWLEQQRLAGGTPALPATDTTKLRTDVQPKGEITGWKEFTTGPATLLAHLEGEPKSNFARVLGPKRGDGGWSQRVAGLSRFETYQLAGRVRTSYPLDFEHRAEMGCDATGQDTDPKAPTIVWAAFPKLQGSGKVSRANRFAPRPMPSASGSVPARPAPSSPSRRTLMTSLCAASATRRREMNSHKERREHKEAGVAPRLAAR